MNVLKINNIERRIIEVLLEVSELSAKEIRQRMGVPVMAVSTISLALRLMENRSILSHRKTEKEYMYFVCFTREELLIREIEDFCLQYFSRDVNEMVDFILSVKGALADKLQGQTNKVSIE